VTAVLRVSVVCFSFGLFEGDAVPGAPFVVPPCLSIPSPCPQTEETYNKVALLAAVGPTILLPSYYPSKMFIFASPYGWAVPQFGSS